MRNNIVHQGAGELSYEIRGIVEKAEKLQELGVKIFWENIGDPVAKGEKIPDWIKDIVKKEIESDRSFAYSPTKGILETRKFLAEICNNKGGVKITPDDIVFFNGLGDAISKIYTYLNRSSRVIGPSPAYPTHSSAEASHSGSHHITYRLMPENGWLLDLDELEDKIRSNPAISGILIINPNNPTGTVYSRETVGKIVEIAKKYDLFIVSDEIYSRIVYDGSKEVASLAEVIGETPGIAMKGISKEFPWPGARCGWIEVYNRDKDPLFSRYIKSIIDAKMLEVCSTTLPQLVIPKITTDPRYEIHLNEKNERYGRKAEIVSIILKNTEGIIVPKTEGAFYMSIVFKNGTLNVRQKLKIENKEAKKFVEKIIKNALPDKRFVYYLLGATGICLVPLSSFNSDLLGFRLTLLESDEEKFKWIIETIAEKIKEYLLSSPSQS
ncbi:MAG: aminotransferase [Candidatus Niyogibacteria bacterium RIFCSPLOWO2_12_FULL_41_13]|uniref:alanine transaminase n=1 Tax=Candidatus Niyogibacteria bacterium RIFCSPLOWO2_12_FULL_41_13 TaxID=1801726 RepID=A0A1G2F4A1_9BACT|nr:MAG: aminotransferase [Candidatus Niyogibacteria bacterium RIFCSPLOWO2_12_FULL_41_13]